MKNTTYKIQFFGGPKKVWKDLPTRLNIATFEEAKDFMKAQQEMCDYMVDFRIVEEVEMFYLTRDALAVTDPMTKKEALAVWTHLSPFYKDPANGKYHLCRADGKPNPTVVMELN